MVQRVPLGEAQARLTELVDAASNGETIFITQDDHQDIQLVPISEG